MDWIVCDDRMPEQVPRGNGRLSAMVEVELSDGTTSEDWLINDKWVIHCKTNGGAFPVRWRLKNGIQR